MEFGSWNQATEPVLTLYHTTVGDIHLDGGAPVPTQAYGDIVAYNGAGTVGNIDMSGDLSGDLEIQIQPHATLTNTGYMATYGTEWGGKIDITGGGSTALYNTGLIDAVDGSNALIDTAVSGTGTIMIAQAGGYSGKPSVLEFGDKVGPGQDIAFSGKSSAITTETLQIDKPGQFLGTIQEFGPNDTIALQGTNESTWTFDTSRDVLKLFDSHHHQLAALQFGGHSQWVTGYDSSPNGGYLSSEFNVVNAGKNVDITFTQAHGTLPLGAIL